MVDAGSIWIKLGLDTTELQNGVAKAKSEMSGVGSSSKITAADLTLLAGGVTAVAGAAYLASEKYGGMAQQLKDLSYTTGFTTQEIQQLQYAAALAGMDTGQLSQSITKLTLSMETAKDPASDAFKAFMGLGIDPEGRTPKEVFDLTAEALVNMKDDTQRNSIAMAIYGKSWKELLPYMDTYIANKDEISKSPVFTDEELAALDEGKQRWDRLNYSFTIYSGKVIAFFSELAAWVDKNKSTLKYVAPFLGIFDLGEEPNTADYSWKKSAVNDTAAMQKKIDDVTKEKTTAKEIADAIKQAQKDAEAELGYEDTYSSGSSSKTAKEKAAWLKRWQSYGGDIPEYASGGIVTKPTLAMVGEAGPEAIVPLSGSGSGGMGGVTFKDCTFNGVTKETVKGLAQELNTYISQKNRGRGTGS